MMVSSASPEEPTASANSRCSAVSSVSSSRSDHPDHAVHGRADLVAHVGQELRLGSGGLHRRVTSAGEGLDGLRAFDHPPELGSDLHHQLQQPGVGLGHVRGEELEHRRDLATDQHG